MRARALAASLLLLLLLPGLAQGQNEGFYDRDGITYYMAVGAVGSGHMTSGLDYAAENLMPFDGCVIAQVNPNSNQGIIRLMGFHDGVRIDSEFQEFHGQWEAQNNGLNFSVLVDGSRTHNREIQHPAVLAGVAAWGDATFSVSEFDYPDPSNLNDDYTATFFVTGEGFRDDETGQTYNVDGGIYEPGQLAELNNSFEAHLRLESKEGSPANSITQSWTRPQGGTLGMFPPDQEYRESFSMRNLRFGGTGQLDVSFTSSAYVGENSLEFLLRSPNGTVLDTFTMSPPATPPLLGAPTTQSRTFALDNFGSYVVEVEGTVSLSTFDISMTQSPGPAVDWHFWWDDVQFSSYAQEAREVCEAYMEGSVTLHGLIPQRPDPTTFPDYPVIIFVAAGITGLVVFIALIALVRAQASRKKLLN